MSKIEEIEQKLNECQKALAELKESKKEGKWKPERNDVFWFRDTYGSIKSTVYTGITNVNIFENTLVFPSKEECEKYWHFMDTVKEKSYEFSKEEWEDSDIGKWRIIYDGEVKGFCVNENYLICVFNATYFKNREDAQYIIDNFKDELMEYWI